MKKHSTTLARKERRRRRETGKPLEMLSHPKRLRAYGTGRGSFATSDLVSLLRMFRRKPHHLRALKVDSSLRWKLISPLIVPSSSSSAHPSPETRSISSDPSQVNSAASAKRVQSRPPI